MASKRKKFVSPVTLDKNWHPVTNMFYFYRCGSKWFGHSCEEPCVHGVVSPQYSDNCTCDSGWTGVNCDSMCTDHGTIVDGLCHCDVGWRGVLCDVAGCPGIGTDCTDHGLCNSITHVCNCFPGWGGDGCEYADCAGNPDCNDRGTCDETHDPPICLDCAAGWMGPACGNPCTYGKQEPANSGFCDCEPCYAGIGCNSECNENGKCNATRNACDCDVGWRGSKCEVPGCAGDEEDCTLHGSCNTANHQCTCVPGKIIACTSRYVT